MMFKVVLMTLAACVHVCSSSTGERCISSCSGMDDGHYQSCQGCHVFASCSGGVFTDNRLCSADGSLVWDDEEKDCLYESSTCTECENSCVGKDDGDYQSCKGCNVYFSCSGNAIHDDRECPGELVWDDDLKRCEWESSTCGDE